MMKNLLALPITDYTIEITIVQGRGLIAKDRHFLTRQRTTSDPYAVVFLNLEHRLGRTKTCPKTLEPLWNATFHCTLPNKKHARVPRNMSTFLGKKQVVDDDDDTTMMEACGMVLIKLYDEDDMTDHDMMGTLLVPIPAGREVIVKKQWYAVDNLFVHNATGEVEVELKVTPVTGKRQTAKDFLPSPDTFARWTGKIAGKKETVNEHGVVVEADTDDRKSYVLALLKQFTE